MRAFRLVCSFLLPALFGLGTLAPTVAVAQLTEQHTPGLRLLHRRQRSVPGPARDPYGAELPAVPEEAVRVRPEGDVTVLLVDLSDKGNAGASTVPNDLVTVQIAPIAYIFETIATNERMNTLMNHELQHIATMDQSAARDRTFRRLFLGKVLPVAEQPESILYFYLTSRSPHRGGF